MMWALGENIDFAMRCFGRMPFDRWARRWPLQTALAVIKIMFTMDVEKIWENRIN